MLAPSEPEAEISKHFVRERDGRLRLRIGFLAIIVALAAFGDPALDFVKDGTLAGDLTDYAMKAGIGLVALIAGLLFEFRKLKNAD